MSDLKEKAAWRVQDTVKERYMLAVERVGEMVREESLCGPFLDYFKRMALFLTRIAREYDFVESGELKRAPLSELQKRNKELYQDILPENYGNSYANPAFACKELGEEFGRLLSFLYAELRSLIPYAYEGRQFEITIRMELFLEIYAAFLCAYTEKGAAPEYEQIRQIVYWFVSDYSEIETMERREEQLSPKHDFAFNIIMDSDLNDVRYLYYYGEYVTRNELHTARHLAELPADKLKLMADTYTEGYRIGFAVSGKDLSKKEVVDIRYSLGFERLIREAVVNFREIGLKASVYRADPSIFHKRGVQKTGYTGASANRQYEYDHKEDDALVLDKMLVNRRMEAQRAALEACKEWAFAYGGPAVVEVFGEEPFAPDNKKEALSYSKAQQRLSVDYVAQSAALQNQYIREEERSFTIIAFPAPEIGERYEEIFDEVIRINTLDYRLYQEIQQKIIDALDQGTEVVIRGMNGNRTDLTVRLKELDNPEKETLFENCVADVNIPVGEVFTSPRLSGTRGTLHVGRVFLNGLEYRGLTVSFEDGMVTDYSCGNFPEEEENRKYIKDNVLFHHESLPLGEFAIGTNTTAYMAAGKYGIADKLPILIAEKMGPHFALGDTCYSHAEELPVYNPDGKEIIARDNSVSLLRAEDPSKAYFNCHTDITIPYDELGELSVVKKDGSVIPVIIEGRFVLEGCEELNRPFEEA